MSKSGAKRKKLDYKFCKNATLLSENDIKA